MTSSAGGPVLWIIGGLVLLFFFIAFLGIIAAIAIPQFAQQSSKAKEASTKGNLGVMRSALSIYYGDQEGRYPQDLGQLIENGKYIQEIPLARTPGFHDDSNEVHVIQSTSISDVTDEGGWGYVANEQFPEWGAIVVNCTHTDSRGKAWAEY